MHDPASLPCPIRTAIIGLGRAGWDIHARWLREDPRFRIISVSDPDAARRQQACHELGCEAFDAVENMLTHAMPELVIVASPSVYHKAHALRAMEAGAHVVIEKPLAGSAQEVDEMIEASHALGRHLMPFQSRRLMHLHRCLKDILQSGRLGRVKHVAYRRYNYIRRDDWQCVLANGGGMLRNHGSHILDQILDLVPGQARRVLCNLERIASAGDAEDHVVILLETRTGVTVHVEISDGIAPQPAPQWLIVGEHGTLTASEQQVNVRYLHADDVQRRPLQKGMAAQGRQYVTPETLPWQDEQFTLRPEPAISFYDAVLQSLVHDKPFLFPPEQVRSVIALLDDCRSQNPRFDPAGSMHDSATDVSAESVKLG